MSLSLLVTGAMAEWMAQPPAVSVGMSSPGTTALATTAYLAPRVPGPWGWLIALAAAINHAVVIRGYPAEAAQGFFMVTGACAAALLVTGAVRRAGSDAEQACAAARRVEREEGGARVHDARSLLRIATEPGADRAALAKAVAALGERTARWRYQPPPGPSPGRWSLPVELARVVAAAPDLRVRVDVRDLATRLDDERVVAVARAVHTLLGNVREHAHAHEVVILGTCSASRWRLSVIDDGCGFDPATITRGEGLSLHAGEGLRRLGIDVSVTSAPGRGTRVELWGVHGAEAREGRFAAWRSRPSGGVARAEWISDVARGLLLVLLWMPLLTGAFHLDSMRRPVLSGTVSTVAALALTAHWLAAARPTPRSVVPLGVASVACGALISLAAGFDALTGPKQGMLIATWALMYTTAAWPSGRWWLLPLAWAQAAVMVRADPWAGLTTSLFASVTIVVTADVASALHRFGAQADRARERAARAERRAAAALLDQHLGALREIALGGGTSGRDVAWPDPADAGTLDPPDRPEFGRLLELLAGDAVTVDVRGLSADPCAAQVRAVTQLLAAMARRPGVEIDIRAAGSDGCWRVSALVRERTRAGCGRPAFGGGDAGVVEVRGVAERRGVLDVRELALEPGLTRLIIQPGQVDGA